MSKLKTPISAVFASPKGSFERNGRLDDSSGGWRRLPLLIGKGTNDLKVKHKRIAVIILLIFVVMYAFRGIKVGFRGAL